MICGFCASVVVAVLGGGDLPSAGSTRAVFILWSESVAVFTPPAQWIARTSALSLLRDALINKLTVTITTPTATSALIEEVVA